MRKRSARLWSVLISLLLLCTGCAQAPVPARLCTVLFEDTPGVLLRQQAYETPAGSDLTVTVSVPSGQRLAADYPRCDVTPLGSDNGRDRYAITLYGIVYPVMVRLTLLPAAAFSYHLPDGRVLTVQETTGRLRPNTSPYLEDFAQPDALPIGWNTAPDGSGQAVSFGSRIDTPGEAPLSLYLSLLPCSPADSFSFDVADNGAVITGWQGSGDLVIPAQLDGLPVTGIAAGAFGEVQVAAAALPPTLTAIEPGAFVSLTADHLYLFDALTQVSSASFGALSVQTLHVNAAVPPVYCGSYFDTFTEKIDRLAAVGSERKLVLFCGSSARFGYDSPQLERAFPAYRVVNLGVYAYANMLPQARIMQRYLHAGDVVLSSPELDAIPEQFCGLTDFCWETFAMTESNYDLLSLLDLREFTGVFDAFAAYQHARSRMSPMSYGDVPAYFDEDGMRRAEPTYNQWGDYILHRENNVERRLFGVKRACYHPDYISAQDLAGLNALYDSLTAGGVQVLFAYSPRSARSITADSDAQSICRLDEMLRRELHAPVITPIEDSLMDALYFYGTDNHLSSEGVQLRTAQVIKALEDHLGVTP